MALGRAFSVAVTGVDGQLVEIEADLGQRSEERRVGKECLL